MEKTYNTQLKVIHFVTDEKFINGSIAFLNEIDGLDNEFLIYSKKTSFEYVSLEQIKRVDETYVKSIITNPEACDVIVIHGLSSLPCRFIMQITNEIKVVWFSWGYDIYSNSYPQFPLVKIKNRIKPETLDIKNKIYYYFKRFVKQYLKRFLNIKGGGRLEFIQAVHRMDYFSGVFSIEYDLVKENPFFRAKPVSYSYVSLNIKDLYKKEDILNYTQPQGDNIQVGNCAAILGNHRTTFNRLNKLDLKDRKIITPLSYGSRKIYVNSVCNSGYKLFGENFIPLIEFMPKDEYFQYMSSVSVAIFNIEQQGAAGNIRMSLWNGVMVFLPEDSIGLKYFKSLGFHIFSIEKDLTQDNIDKGLSKEQVIENRRLMCQTTSYEVLKENVNNTFGIIFKDIKNHF